MSDIKIVLLNENQAIVYYETFIEEVNIDCVDGKYIVDLNKLNVPIKQFSIDSNIAKFEELYTVNENNSDIEETTKSTKSKKLKYCNWKNYCKETEYLYYCCHYCPKKDKCKESCKCKDKLSTCTYRLDYDKNIKK